MRLKINHFAKIEYADMKMDGITVIAGSNNTGKSTVGKILFSIFNSLSDIDDKILEQRKKEMFSAYRDILRDALLENCENTTLYRRAYERVKHTAPVYVKEYLRYDHEGIGKLIELLKQNIPGTDLSEDYLEELVIQINSRIEAILDLDDEVLVREIINRYFGEVFRNQMNSLADTGTVASLDLEIKRKNIRLEFRNQECVACDNRIALMHKAVYIDNPLVVDSMTNFPGLNIMEYELVRLLNFRQSNPIDGVVESVLNKEKLETIYQTLNSVVSGQIIQKQDGEYYLQEDEQAEPVHFGNLSNGVKAFLIIRMLLEKGLLKEKDVLILDEPEIHLHPEWQTVYAEIIVLLQKYFDLTIVVTTHSPYFMDAINLYSRKHGVAEKTNYYLSEVDDNRVRMKDVTENLEEIYSKMTTPIQILENLRYELDY